MQARCSTRSSICSAGRPATSWRISAATRARSPIRRAPRTRRCRFLDRLGGPRRGANAVRIAGAGLRQIAWLGEGPPRGSDDRAGRRRRNGRGQHLRGAAEGWKHGLRNTWWVVDYNRQSLDAVVREGLWEKFETMFRNFGWDVVIVKYGRLMRQAFAEPGGEALSAGSTIARTRSMPRSASRAAPPSASISKTRSAIRAR